jgi:hypothetical protein
MWLYLWEKWGYELAEQKFQKDYSKDKGHVKKNGSKLHYVIDGKLEFLKMVKGANNSTYIKLKSRFEKLVRPCKEIIESKEIDLESILEVFSKSGLREAMELFKKN